MSNSPDNDSGLALRINGYTQLSHVVNPSSQTGPEPMKIPVTGFSIVAEMVCLDKIDYRILGFRAEVIRQTSFQSDGTMIGGKPSLEIPHFEILLDKHPPIIRPALKADGQPARPTPQLPFTLHPNEYRKFFLAPVTHSPDLTVWSLYDIWEIEGERHETPCGTFQVTGYTGWKIFHAQGGSSPAPVGQAIAHEHWDIKYNSGF
jgi:hypothetical protein